ncbi:MAG: polysaccharide deacetylase family protein [Candidatus Gottesmanbacteria bacterium]
MKKIFITILWLFFLLYFPCKIYAAGLALSFDDDYVDEWYAMRDLLNSYNAKVTFFVTNLNSLTVEEWNKLEALKRDGHEIDSHGYTHLVASNYIATYSMNQYLQNEILPSIRTLNNYGFYPIAFAYPTGAHTFETDNVLLGYFPILRTTITTNGGLIPIKDIDSVFYKFDGATVLTSVGIDNIQGNSIDSIMAGLQRAKDQNEVLLIHGHRPLNSTENTYITNISKLEAILSYAQNHGLHFYTFSELVNPQSSAMRGDINRDNKVDNLDCNQLITNFTNIFYYNLIVGNFGK